MWALCFLFVLKYVQCTPRLDPLVDTGVGLIRGLPADDGDYSMFLGIPYADIDLSNPFGVATPSERFTEVFEAYNDSAMCPQQEQTNKTIAGTLDCLKLSVFVPNVATSQNKLPVMIWVHGGTLVNGNFGKNPYGAKYLAKLDVILVTINYRLGPYGFMCLDTPEVPGNQGLKDQYLAIKWVKENIAAFGGDENKLTVMGQSAGSKSVELHLLSQRPRLFQQAILQSGSSLGPAIVEPADKTAPAKIAKVLGYDTEDMTQALEFLIQSDPLLVVAAALEAGVTFQVCVEKEFDNVERFVFEHPEFSDYSKASDMPIMGGFTNNELITMYNNANDFFRASIIKERLMSLFEFGESRDMQDFIRHFYLGDDDVDESKKLEIIDFLSDYVYDYPVQRSLMKFNDNGNNKIYQYLFSYNGGRNFAKKRYNLTVGGAAHADEIGYIFDPLILKDSVSPEDILLVTKLTTLWTNFAKYGNPTPEASDLLPFTWSPMTKESIWYLDIDEELSMKLRPLRTRMVFWDLFFTAYMRNHRANLGYFD